MLVLPSITEADPEVRAETSLDPLGLSAVSDQLGELLLPGITNRMRRPRFLTAMAVGAIACSELDETVVPADDQSTPSTAFEWLVLESFVRRVGSLGPEELKGVAGIGKARTVVAEGGRLAASNYLKTPSVFGFTGILLPLAKSIRVVGADRNYLDQAWPLLSVWEREVDLQGFTDNLAHTRGGDVRRRIRASVRASLESGRCAEPIRSHLLGTIAASLAPRSAGSSERGWIRAALLDPEAGHRAEIGRLLARRTVELTDVEIADVIRTRASQPLKELLAAVSAYEAAATRLECVMDRWQRVSAHRGSAPVSSGDIAADSMVQRAAKTMRTTIQRARNRVDPLPAAVATSLDKALGPFDGVSDPDDLAERVMEHHIGIQTDKPPHGKRPWFEETGSGYVVRPQFRPEHDPWPGFDHYDRPYRLRTFHQLLLDVR